MMRALIEGSASAAVVAIVCTNTMSNSVLRYGPKDGCAGAFSARRAPGAGAVQEHLDELLGRHGLVGEHRVRRRERERAQQPRRGRRARSRMRSRFAANRPTSASLSVTGRRVISWKRVPTLDTRRQMSMTRCWMSTTAAARPSSNATSAGIPARAASSGAGSRAASMTATMISSLSAKARKWFLRRCRRLRRSGGS